jgi:hypothetical protein
MQRLASFIWPWSKVTWIFVIWTIAMVIVWQVLQARVASICAEAADVAHCEQGEMAAYLGFSVFGLLYLAWFMYAAVWAFGAVLMLIRRLWRAA